MFERQNVMFLRKKITTQHNAECFCFLSKGLDQEILLRKSVNKSVSGSKIRLILKKANSINRGLPSMVQRRRRKIPHALQKPDSST
jgi:hypothetical protein